MSINVCNDRSMASITSLPSGVTGSSLVLISTVALSSAAADISFTSGIASTYKEYIFKIFDINIASDTEKFGFNGTTDGTNFNVTKTSSFFRARLKENDSSALLAYYGDDDVAQGTGLQPLQSEMGSDNDQCLAGTLHLFDPSNTTFVKHFVAITNNNTAGDGTQQGFVGGYFNTTSAITGIKFQSNTGNIDAGTIKMYGVL